MSIHWLEPLKYPLVNKFYKAAKLNSKAKRNDKIAVAVYQSEIIAAGLLRQFADEKLLTGMGVATEFRKVGLGKKLLQFMREEFDSYTYCFSLNHLDDWYIESGFEYFSAKELPEALLRKWNAYVQQGRKISCLRFSY